MSVFRALMDFEGRDASGSDSGEDTYTKVFTVETTDPRDGPEVMKDHSGIPSINDPYVGESGVTPYPQAYCVGVRYIQTTNRKVWRVVASYSNRLERPDEALLPPDQRKHRIEWDTITSSYATDRDNRDQPILNAAGDPFDPPVSAEDSWQLLRITRNQKKYPKLEYLKYHGKVNSKKWNGYKPKQVKCRKIRGTDFFEGAEWWFRVTFEFEIKEDRIPLYHKLISEGEPISDFTRSYAWITWILNRGYREYGTWPGWFEDNTTFRIITDPNSKLPVTSPYPLNEDGLALPLGGKPLYLGFEIPLEIDFDPLGILLNDDDTP